MARYDPLHDELFRDGRPKITMTFDELERLVGPLPPSALNHDRWWANEDHHTTRHVQCKAWGAAGYSVSVDRASRRANFTRN